MAGQARVLPMITGCGNSVIITTRACLAHVALLAQALSGAPPMSKHESPDALRSPERSKSV
jgi:hypothetical protein